MNACAQCAVRDSAICHSVSTGDLEELARGGRRQMIHRGQTLIWEGEDSLLVGNVIEGVLKLSHATSDGRDQTLGIVYPGDFIGRAFGAKSHQTVTAVTDAKICTFRRSAFDEFARKHPDLEHDLLERTLGELDELRQWMVLLARLSAAERLASFLLQMANRIGAPMPGSAKNEAAPVEFTLPFGRQEIADLLGLTIETVSRQFTRFRNDGIIETPDRRSVVILDREGLEDLVP